MIMHLLELVATNFGKSIYYPDFVGEISLGFYGDYWLVIPNRMKHL